MAKKIPPTQVVLSQDVLAAIKERQAIIDQYRHILSCLEMERDALLLNVTGVDVRKEAWNFDMQRGVLERAGSN